MTYFYIRHALKNGKHHSEVKCRITQTMLIAAGFTNGMLENNCRELVNRWNRSAAQQAKSPYHAMNYIYVLERE